MSNKGAETQGAVELSFTYTEDEYIAAARLFYSRGYDSKFHLHLGLGLLACALLFAWLGGDVYIAGLALLAGCLLIAWRHYVNSTLPRMHFRRNPKFRQPYELSFADDGILFRSTDMESRVAWDFYTSVWETKDFYFLVYGKDMFSLVPKRVFRGPRQEAAFRELLGRKLDFGAARLPAAADSQAPERAYVPPAEPPDWR
jgi:YcxB-like protein